MKGDSKGEKTTPKNTQKKARINTGLKCDKGTEIHKEHYQTILSYEKDNENIPTGVLIELWEIYHYPMDFIFLGKTYGLKSIKEKAS